MNKILLSVVFFLSAAVSAFAGKDVKVKSGDIHVLEQKVAFRCVVELDGATWEEDETFKEHCGEDYDLRVKIIKESWPKFFAKYSNGPIVSDENPVYKAVFKLTNLEKSIAKSMWGKIGLEYYGEVYIVNIATGETVLTISINGKDGPYDYVENDCYAKTMDAMCEDIFDLL